MKKVIQLTSNDNIVVNNIINSLGLNQRTMIIMNMTRLGLKITVEGDDYDINTLDNALEELK